MYPTIAVGTESDLKLRAVRAALDALGASYEIRGVKAESGVSDQPFGFDKIVEGANNRARNALELVSEATLGIGIESGLVQINGLCFDPPCVAILSRDVRLQTHYNVAFGAFLPIPTWVVDRIKAKQTELGVVVQELSGGGEKDPHNYFSENRLKREQIIEQAVLCALIPTLCRNRYRIWTT